MFHVGIGSFIPRRAGSSRPLGRGERLISCTDGPWGRLDRRHEPIEDGCGLVAMSVRARSKPRKTVAWRLGASAPPVGTVHCTARVAVQV